MDKNDSTQDVRSHTLDQVKALPQAVCVGCPNAVWHLVRMGNKEHLRVYCLLMHALIDDMMTLCDGRKMYLKNA